MHQQKSIYFFFNATKRIVSVSLVFVMFLQLVLSHVIPTLTYASWVQDNIAGMTKTDFRNNLAGISAGNNYIHTPSGIGTITSAGGIADFTTSDVHPTNFGGRSGFVIDYTGTAPSFEIQQCDGTPVLSLTPYTGPVDLTDSLYVGFTCLQARVEFDENTTIDNATFFWIPKPVVSLELTSTSAAVTPGQCVTYKVKRSMSFFNNPNTAVYATIPYASGSSVFAFDANTINTNLGQFPFSNLIPTNITNSGKVNTGDNPLILANGLEIPPHSVYWEPTNAANGSTQVYQFQLCSDKGMQNAISYEMVAGIQGSLSPFKVTPPLVTTIQSTGKAASSCVANKQYVFSSIPGSKVVNYTYTFSHDTNISTEDIFDPTAELDFNDTISDLMNACGLSEADAISRITLPVGFSALSIGTHTATYAFPSSTLFVPNNYYFNDQNPKEYTRSTAIDYAGCTASFVADSILYVGGSNITSSSSTCSTHHEYTIPANASVGDFVWSDANNNGTQDNGETGIGGVGVELRYCSGNPLLNNQRVATGVSAANGSYGFANLPIGTYKIVFSLPNPNTSGFQWTSANGSAASGSDAGIGGETACFSLVGNQVNNEIDAGLIMVSGGGGGGGSGEPLWYNKCMYTTTTDEYRYGAGGAQGDTNWENVASNPNGFYDNDCNDNDTYNSITKVEVNASGETFYHLNYHGDTPGLVSQSVPKMGVWAVDRVDSAFLVQGVDVWTNASGWSADASNTRAKSFCHTSTSSTMPTINTGVLDGTVVPTAATLGAGWSETCDGNSHWVISAMQCINSSQNPAASGSACYGAPSRYQFRIHVTPNQPQNLTCGGSITTTSVANTSTVYQGNTYVDAPHQTSEIINTPLSSQITISDITSNFYGPVNSPLPIGYTGHVVYLRQNFSTQTVSGNVFIQLTPAAGICPVVSGLMSGYIYDANSCQISGEIPTVVSTGTAEEVCQFQQQAVFSCSDIPGNDNELDRNEQIGRPWILSLREVYEKVGGPNCSINGSEYHNQTEFTPRGDVALVQFYHGGNTDVSAQFEFQYDALHRRTEQKRLSWNGTSLDNNRKQLYTYLSGTNNLIQKTDYYRDGTVRQQSAKREFTYNGQNNVEEAMNFSWDSNLQSWNKQTKYNYVYNGNDDIIERWTYNWNGASWAPSEKFNFSYDQASHMLMKEQYSWNGSSYAFGLRMTFEYDAAGRKISESNQNIWCSNPTGICNRDEFIYDTNDRLIERKEYYWNGSTLMYGTRVEFNYSTAGNLITRKYFSAQCVSTPPVSAQQYLELGFDIVYTQGSDNESVPLSSTEGVAAACTSFSHGSYQPLTLTTALPPPPPPVDTGFNNPPLATPHLITNKYVDKTTIGPNGEIIYTMQVTNIGDAWATNVYLIDPLAPGLEFISALTSGGVVPGTTTDGNAGSQPLSTTTYYCPVYQGLSCSVWAALNAINPSIPDPQTPYTTGDIQASFVQIDENAPGEWTTSAGTPTALAYFMPYLLPGQVATFQMKVKNVANVWGDVIANSAATISDQLIQMVSNTVYTNLLPNDPNSIDGTIYWDKDGSKDYLSGTDGVLSGVTVILYDKNFTPLLTSQTDAQGYFIFENLPDNDYILMYDPASVGTAQNPSLGTGVLTPFSATAGYIIVKGSPETRGNPETSVKITGIGLAGGMNQKANYFGLAQIPYSDLSINKKFEGITPVLVGSTGNFVITIANLGDEAAGNIAPNPTSIIVTESLPAGMSIVAESLPSGVVNVNATNQGDVTYSVESLEPLETKNIVLTVMFSSSGDFLNVADIWDMNPAELHPYDGIGSIDRLQLLTNVNPLSGAWSYPSSGVFGSVDYVRGSNNVDAVQVVVIDAPVAPNTISGIIYEDADASSGYTLGDALFSGVSVQLYSGVDLLATALTDDQGQYLFTNIPDGVYRIVYDPSSIGGFEAMVVTIGSLGGTPVGLTEIENIVVGGGVTSSDNNFGLTAIILPSTINGQIQTNSGSGIGGASIELRSSTGALIATVQSAADGTYIFTGLLDGTYTIGLAGVTGYTIVSSSAGGIGSGSVQGGANANSIEGVAVSNGTLATGNNFTIAAIILPPIITLPSTINGQIQTNSGSGIGGASIELRSSTGALIATVQSAADGTYIFTGLLNGTYTIGLAGINGYTIVSSSAGEIGSGSVQGGANANSIEGVAVSNGIVATGNNFKIQLIPIVPAESTGTIVNGGGGYSGGPVTACVSSNCGVPLPPLLPQSPVPVVIDPTIIKSNRIEEGKCYEMKTDRTVLFQNDVTRKYSYGLTFALWYDLTKYNGTLDFRPLSYMTREESARLLSQFARNVLCRKPHLTYNESFIDLTGADDTLVWYIKDSYELGIFKGHAGQFRPHDYITQQEFASAVIRLLTHNIDEEQSEDRWKEYKALAENMGLFNEYYWNYSGNVRKDAIYRLFSAYKNYDYTREDFGYLVVLP